MFQAKNVYKGISLHMNIEISVQRYYSVSVGSGDCNTRDVM